MADITKGSKVEVSSNEPGFHGAWYVATLVDIDDNTPIKDNSNKKTPNKRYTKKPGYVVRYDTLFEEEDLGENLCETVDPMFVRPIPPPNAVVDGHGQEFKVDDVIDAYHRDGWWIGVVKKVVMNSVEEEHRRKYLVGFENPPEEVEFEEGQLRFHVDWVDSCWQVPTTINNKKMQEHESTDINATQTAESNNDAQSGFTTPSRAARPTDLENPSTRCLRSAKKRSRLQQNTESNSEMIGAVEGTSTYNLRKTRSRTVNSVEENSCGDRSQASAGGKRKKTVQVPLMERSGSQAMHQDSPIVEQKSITEATSEAEEGQSQQRTKKGRPLLLEETSKTRDGKMFKSPNGLQKGNQNARNRDSSAFSGATSELEDVPLSVWRQGLCPRSVLNRSSCRNLNLPDNHNRSSGAPMPLSQAIVSNGGTNNEQQVWPFVKQSFFWATIESTELHQKQKPHFSPLKKMKEGCREGYAIGHMVTFENVIRDVLNYQPSNPVEKINNNLELLDELEPHGFDVSAVRGRLNTFLSSKVKVGELKDELKKFENDIEICNVEKRAVEEELNELEVKIQELQEMKVQNVKMKAAKDQDIKRLQSNVDLVANQITEAELAIEKLAARPL